MSRNRSNPIPRWFIAVPARELTSDPQSNDDEFNEVAASFVQIRKMPSSFGHSLPGSDRLTMPEPSAQSASRGPQLRKDTPPIKRLKRTEQA
jgi:hypothetical protein